MVQKAQAEDSKSQTRQMHAAVASLGKSKKTLHDLVLARSQLHQSWHKFLEGAIARWQKFATDFQEQDKAFGEKIEEAKSALAASEESFRLVQSTTDMPEVAEEISEDETIAPPQKIEEYMGKLTATLQELKGGVEEEIAQQANKRARIEKEEDGQDGQHFQKGGKWVVHLSLVSALWHCIGRTPSSMPPIS